MSVDAKRSCTLTENAVSPDLDLEQRFGRVMHLPDYHGGNFDRIAALVVDFQFFAVEIARAERDADLGIERIGEAIEKMADAEGLYAHKNAVSLRLNKLKKGEA